MDLINRISENFSESAHLKLQSMDALAGPIAAAAERMVQCLKLDGKIMACGNGGWAAD
jgi:D-sedoheptulose 7-phosphate isomerase